MEKEEEKDNVTVKDDAKEIEITSENKTVTELDDTNEMNTHRNLFDECILDIIILPNVANPKDGTDTTADSVLRKPSRQLAFYDERLHFYVLVKLSSYHPNKSLISQDIANAFFERLKVSADASLVEGTPTDGPTTPTMTSAPVSLPPTPKAAFLTSFSFEGEKTIAQRNTDWVCLFPMSFLVTYVQTHWKTPVLALTGNISLGSQRKQIKSSIPDGYVTKSSYTTINILEALTDDPMLNLQNLSFSSTRLPPQVHRRAFSVDSPAITPYIGNEEQEDENTNVSSQLQRSFTRAIPVFSALEVHMRTTTIFPLDSEVIVSVEIENNLEKKCPFVISSIDVEVANDARVEMCNAHNSKIIPIFPFTLSSMDHLTILYRLILAGKNSGHRNGSNGLGISSNPEEEIVRSPLTPRIASSMISPRYHPSIVRQPQRFVSITVKGSPIIDGEQGPLIESKWNCNLDLNNGQLPTPDPQHNSNSTARNGLLHANSASFSSTSPLPMRTPTAGTAPNRSNIPIGGVIVSFSQPNDPISPGCVFTIEMMIINRSNHERNFEILVPQKRRPTHRRKLSDSLNTNLSRRSIGSGINNQGSRTNLNSFSNYKPLMDPIEFLRRHADADADDATLLCLESNLKVGTVFPSACQIVHLRLVGLQAGLRTLEHVQLRDRDTGFITNLRNVSTVWVK